MTNNQNIITKDDINKLLEKYDINKTALSQLLGWGQNTIARYLSDQSLPSIEYSKTLRKLYNPSEMRMLLHNNSKNIAESIVSKLNNKITDIQFETLEEEFPGKVFIKELKSQELGYRNGIPNKAGAYLLVPKSTIDFFPHLSNTNLNDNTTLKIKIAELDKNVDVTYTYHNSKYASPDPKNTRDEYRLYLSHLDIFIPDDIALFIKTSEPKSYSVYKIPKNSELHAIFSAFINMYKKGKSSSAIVPISLLIANRIKISELYSSNISLEETKELLYEPIQEDTDDISVNTYNDIDISNLFEEDMIASNLDTFVEKAKKVKRNEKFKKAVLNAYNYKCCISNSSICFNKLTNLQAAHIIPKYLKGSDNPKNGLSLSHDLHWAFDNGFFTITDFYTIMVHEKVSDNPILKQYDGKKIILPEDKRFYPSLIALKFHRNNIFGKFLNR